MKLGFLWHSRRPAQKAHSLFWSVQLPKKLKIIYDKKWSKNSLTGISLGIRWLWGINSLYPSSSLDPAYLWRKGCDHWACLDIHWVLLIKWNKNNYRRCRTCYKPSCSFSTCSLGFFYILLFLPTYHKSNGYLYSLLVTTNSEHNMSFAVLRTEWKIEILIYTRAVITNDHRSRRKS